MIQFNSQEFLTDRHTLSAEAHCRYLSTALVFVEVHEAGDTADHISFPRHHSNGRRAQGRLVLHQ